MAQPDGNHPNVNKRVTVPSKGESADLPDDHKRSPGRPRAEDSGIPVRDRVLRTASELFMEFGYEAVSLNQIAEQCGVTKASVYYHFSSKPVLFTAAVTAMLRGAKAGTARYLDREGTFRDKLLQIAESRLDRSHHAEFETLMREASHSLAPEQKEAIFQAEAAIHELLAVHFRQAMDQGVLKTGDPLLMVHSYSALLMIGNRKVVQAMYATTHELASQIMDMFWSGVAP